MLTVCFHATMDEYTPMELVFVNTIKNLLAKGIITEAEAKKFIWPTHNCNRQEWERILKNLDAIADVKLFEFSKHDAPQYSDYLDSGEFEVYRTDLAGNASRAMRLALNKCLDSERDKEEREEIVQKGREEMRSLIPNSEMFVYLTTVVLQKKS